MRPLVISLYMSLICFSCGSADVMCVASEQQQHHQMKRPNHLDIAPGAYNYRKSPLVSSWVTISGHPDNSYLMSMFAG